MAEEKKSNVGKMLMKIILGILLIAVGAFFIYTWWQDLLTLIKGAVGIVFVLAGLIFFAIAKD